MNVLMGHLLFPSHLGMGWQGKHLSWGNILAPEGSHPEASRTQPRPLSGRPYVTTTHTPLECLAPSLGVSHSPSLKNGEHLESVAVCCPRLGGGHIGA